MRRITFRISYERRIVVLLICIFVSLFISGSVWSVGSPIDTRASPLLTYFPYQTGRHIYLTNTSYATNHTLTACAVGYHMASLWEMLDVSNMIYDNTHPAAYNKADSGYGPPSNWYGWVRTGFNSSNSITTGSGNCNTWTSISTGDYGVSVRLSNTWEAAPGDIVTWDATSFTCNYTGPVWCVGDFYQSYLPLAVNNH
jgi:hypothetical protein